MMHEVRGYSRFAHIDGLITADPAVDARLPKVHRDESRIPATSDITFAPALLRPNPGTLIQAEARSRSPIRSHRPTTGTQPRTTDHVRLIEHR